MNQRAITNNVLLNSQTASWVSLKYVKLFLNREANRTILITLRKRKLVKRKSRLFARSSALRGIDILRIKRR